MSKEEFFKEYKEIILKTNGGNDDYVVALCQISNLIKDYAEEKEQEIADLEAKLAEKDKEKNKMICHIGYDNLKYLMANNDWQILEAHQVKEYNQLRKANQDKISFAIEQLEKVNGILTDTIVDITKNEFDINKLCYLEEISARFYEKMQQRINELKGDEVV